MPPLPTACLVGSVTAAAAPAKRTTGVHVGFLERTQAVSRDCRERLPGPLDILPSLPESAPHPEDWPSSVAECFPSAKGLCPCRSSKEEPVSD